MKPYLLTSDLHFHEWTAFARVLPNGLNSRLHEILCADVQAYDALIRAGGDQAFIAGDIQHVRGKLSPTVLNPVSDHYKTLVQEMGVKIAAISGNHDATFQDANRLGSSVTAMENVGVSVVHEPSVYAIGGTWMVAMFSWVASLDELLAQMKRIRKDHESCKFLDAVIHAPVNGVLSHLPDHGLDPNTLADLGYHRVFCGHYHNHRDLGRGVYSIGALTHQTFGDIGSKAGYCLVYPDRVEHYETAAPKFVELTGDETEEEADAKIKGNYVRVRFSGVSDEEAEELREAIFAKGAAGVSMQVVPNITVTRSATATSGGASIEKSIGEFITKKGYANGVQALCEDILTEARVGE